MITREQVADLREGDVVEYSGHPNLNGALIRGPLYGTDGALHVGSGYVVRFEDGRVWRDGEGLSLTVVSRAPRPLYVNHPRTEPVPGDVVRDGQGVLRHCTRANDSDDGPVFWAYDYEPGWRWTWTGNPPGPLTLLVDGETGQVVTS